MSISFCVLNRSCSILLSTAVFVYTELKQLSSSTALGVISALASVTLVLTITLVICAVCLCRVHFRSKSKNTNY